MNLSERISKLKGYFQLFNITDDAAYVMVNLPETWSVPSSLEDDDVSVAKTDGNSYYFYCESDKDAEVLFDAIDYIISFNKAIEEKTKLLVEKVEELKDIFANESLEKLRTLTFSFEDDTTKKNKDIIAKLELSVKPKQEKKKKEKKVEPKAETKADEPEIVNEDEVDGSIMDLAKNVVGE